MKHDLDLSKINSIHFIGIGGIGISAIARMMLLQGKKVSGSDSSPSEVTEELVKLGAEISIGQKAENLKEGIDLVVYTIAITPENLEFAKAKELGVKMLTYPEMLAVISADKYTIAISGTHGKTTTTAMIAKVMIDAGLDPTVIVGSLLKDHKSNFIAGKSKYFVVEACEYRRSFLNLSPKILVINNIDNDHLDYYKDIADIQSAFKELAMKIPEDGYLICNANDPLLKPIIESVKCKVVDYKKDFEKLILKVPGDHNQSNANVAIKVSEILGIEKGMAIKSLADFSGTWRRFEYKGETKEGALIYDDYGHHPTEIEATLAGAREMFPDKKLVAIFQPHLFSRTKILAEQFGKAFKNASEVVLAPIYAAREIDDGSYSSEMLAKEIEKNGEKVSVLKTFDTIADYLKTLDHPDTVFITVGAGDIYKVCNKIC
jgi:UDP-N-acetylmuramate--alanine ligase